MGIESVRPPCVNNDAGYASDIIDGTKVQRQSQEVDFKPLNEKYSYDASTSLNNITRSYGAKQTEINESTEDEVQRLIDKLSDENFSVRIDAAMALGVIGSAAESAIPALIAEFKACIRSGAYASSYDICYALGRIGPAAVPALIEILEDENSEIRTFTAFALGRIHPITAEVVPALIKALGDEVPEVRIYAAMSLRDIGLAAEEAIPELERLASHDEKAHVRGYASEALCVIRSAIERAE